MSRDYILQPFQTDVRLQIDYAAELNPQQYEAVTALPAPSLVIAGAGSGKTRTLTYRVAYLLEQGIPPERILLLTFTNKAAREMMRRVADVLGHDISSLWGGTFHSIGNRILRKHAALLGYKPDFTILDREDAKDLLKAAVDDAKIDVTESRFPKADVIADIFSMVVNTEKSIPQILEEDYPHFQQGASVLGQIQVQFSVRKKSSNVMDFDDLLVLWYRLLKEHPSVCEFYQKRFQFLLVDEYQDTNKLQSDLIDLLAARHHNVTVVGDDSQSIYSWRGANFLNILEFPKRYPGAKVYKIETNYRSTPEILSLANAAIAANTRQYSKQLVSNKKSGSKPVLVPCGDAAVQAAFIAQRVLELREEGTNLNEIAVLYRSHFHALELQLELTRRNIPFSITSGIRFFEQAHIKDVAAYLKFVANPSDEIAFKRIVRLMPGVGGKAAEKLWDTFQAELANVVASAKSPIATALQRSAAKAPKKTEVAWAQFTATISQLEHPPISSRPAEMIRLIMEAGYIDYLKEAFSNYLNRKEEIEQLANFAAQFKSTEEFLSQLALLTNIESEEDRPGNDDELLRLSTIHQAKGLEYQVVFILMLCEGLFPSIRSLDRPEVLEEERRLFYVAITRAKQELYLSYPLIRFTRGEGASMQQPSQFLSELPKQLFEEWNLVTTNPWG
ncbi:MAG: ATP-dependent helicase [Verrucomicrobiota bacterium]|nr:ATP-dependent helicase [Verrucomicrobiota bacterium]